MIEAGLVKTVEIDSHVFVTTDSLEDWAKEERKSGRPVNPASKRQLALAALKEGFHSS